jgi:purine-cytosine permease-like protein
MNSLKRFLGILWVAVAIGAVFVLFRQASVEFSQNPALDTRIFWWMIIPIFLPIMGGLGIFGWYCLRGEYDRMIEN